MPTQITPELLKPYFEGTKKHGKYQETCEQYAELKVHADGEYPKEIIESVRPQEPLFIKERRKRVFAAITKPVIGTVLNSLNKIRKSSEYQIKYDKKAVNDPLIKEGETLYDYMETKFPVFGSATGWLFNDCLKQYCIDSDAVCLVIPLQWNLPANEFRKPFPFIFNSPYVLEFKENDYAILKSPEGVVKNLSGGGVVELDVYIVVTTTDITVYEQQENRKGWLPVDVLVHNSGRLPAFRLGGVVLTRSQGQYIWTSRLSPMLPYLKEAVREYSDMQAAVEMHLFLERWEYDAPICGDCNGLGTVIKNEVTVKCPNVNCKSGQVERSPYQVHIVKPPMPGENPPPTPPGGYFDKDVEIIKIQDARIDKHLFKAFASVSMEFLFKTPLSESGLAKQWDRDEATNFVHACAEDLVRIMDFLYWFSNHYRYMDVIKDVKRRLSFLPTIPVPEKYDIFTSAMLIEEIKALPETTPTPIKKAIYIELAGKKFSHDDSVSRMVQLNLSLDPLPGLTVDEKASMKMNGGVTEEDYVISCQLDPFIARAMEEDESFPEKPLSEKLDVLRKFAKEVIAANDAAVKILPDNEPQDDEPIIP
jgi:hypothetical protein